MTDKTATAKAAETTSKAVESAVEEAFDLSAAAAYFREHSEVQKNGVRVIKADALHKHLQEHNGITEEELKKVQEGLTDARSAAALVAGEDLEESIVNARKAGKSEDDIRALTATIRFPLFGQEEDLSVLASEKRRTGKKSGDDSASEHTDYGVVTSRVTRHIAMRKPVVESLSARIARAMNSNN